MDPVARQPVWNQRVSEGKTRGAPRKKGQSDARQPAVTPHTELRGELGNGVARLSPPAAQQHLPCQSQAVSCSHRPGTNTKNEDPTCTHPMSGQPLCRSLAGWSTGKKWRQELGFQAVRVAGEPAVTSRLPGTPGRGVPVPSPAAARLPCDSSTLRGGDRTPAT